MRFFYNLLWFCLSGFLPFLLRKKAKKNPDYLEHWGERFGKPLVNPKQGVIWIHAVSVGETRAVAPLLSALKQHYPDVPVLLTQMTPTGRATAMQLYPDVQCRYLPYDRADWVRQFLLDHRPLFGILMETEIWPNLILECANHNIPLFLANARLSEKSQQGYQKIRYFIQPILRKLTACFAQTQADAARLQTIGVESAWVCGNTKYDIVPNVESKELADVFRQRIGTRPIFVAASTRYYHEQDEAEMILRAWQGYEGDALLVLIPRHPERFQAAFDLAKQLGFKVQKRSDELDVQADTQVWIGDSMGELFAYYQLADVVFVGGSLVDSGCQNIIEPLSCGKTVCFGPSTYNFQAACAGALEAGVAVQVCSADDLVQKVKQWLSQPETVANYSEQALAFVKQHQGAGQRIADGIVAIMQGKQQ